MPIVRGFPLFAVLLVVYNLMLLIGDMPGALDKELFRVGLLSQASWSANAGDLMLMFGVLFLYIEMFKATRTGNATVVDHALSVVVFVIFLIEFIAVQGAAHSVFLILTLMAALDVVAGFTITIVAARRDFALGERDL